MIWLPRCFELLSAVLASPKNVIEINAISEENRSNFYSRPGSYPILEEEEEEEEEEESAKWNHSWISWVVVAMRGF